MEEGVVAPAKHDCRFVLNRRRVRRNELRTWHEYEHELLKVLTSISFSKRSN